MTNFWDVLYLKPYSASLLDLVIRHPGRLLLVGFFNEKMQLEYPLLEY